MARPGNVAGLIPDTERRTICEAPDNSVRIIRLITLYNASATDVTGTLRLLYTDDLLDEIPIRRWAFKVPAADGWSYGTQGGILVLDHPTKYYEVVLDAVPAEPIEFAVDYADEP